MAKKFIFSSSSYLVVFKTPKNEKSVIETTAKSEGFRVFYADTMSDLEECVQKIQYPVDYYLHAKNGDLSTILFEENLLKKHGLHYEILSDISDAAVTPVLHASLERLMPKGIPALIETAANFVFPRVFPKVLETTQTAQLTPTKGPASGYDFIVLGSSVSDDWVGQCLIWLRFGALKKEFPAFANQTEAQILDGMRELANQLIGVVNFNLGNINIRASGTLPIGFDLRSGAEKPRSTIYTRPVSLELGTGALRVDFGPLLSGPSRVQNSSRLELDQIRFAEPGEVEML